MSIRKPNRLSKDSLHHPKSKGTEYKRFNGETAIRGERWNGSADWDEPEGFSNRVHTVEGTAKPSNVASQGKPPLPAPPLGSAYQPAVPDLFGRPAMRVEENQRPRIISPEAEAPAVYALKKAKEKDEADRGWRFRFNQEKGDY